MARTTFDPGEFLQMLQASGFPREKAEALTWDTSCLFVHRLDALDVMECVKTHTNEVESNLVEELGCRFGKNDQRLLVVERRLNYAMGLIGVTLVAVALLALLRWMGY